MITPDGVALAIGAVLLAYGWGFWHGRRRQRATENEGEGAVRSALTRAFSGPAFHLMNNLTLPDGDGTTQIDHVLITRTGIFVIEAKHYKGVIEAHASAATWSFHYGPRTYVRQNPLRQNYRHVKAVERLLGDIYGGPIQNMVVFTGTATFEHGGAWAPFPDGVFNVPGLVQHIRNATEQVLMAKDMHLCVGRLECTRKRLSRQTDVEHQAYLDRKFGELP